MFFEAKCLFAFQDIRNIMGIHQFEVWEVLDSYKKVQHTKNVLAISSGNFYTEY